MVPACSSGTLTNVLLHRNSMPQTQDTTPHPVTAYRHRADLSLCYPLMWNVTLDYTATHFNVLGTGIEQEVMIKSEITKLSLYLASDITGNC